MSSVPALAGRRYPSVARRRQLLAEDAVNDGGIPIWSVIVAGFGAAAGAIGHLYHRLNAIDADAERRIKNGDDPIWAEMRERHKENQDALAAMRGEVLAELHALRSAIDTDRRAQIEQLRADMRDLKGRGA